MTRLLRALTVVATASILLSGCASDTRTSSPSGSAAPSASALEGDITVFAAASLTETFTELAASFEAEHPGTSITLNFAGSSALATQIIEGAPADVFASADTSNMAKVVDAGLAAADPVDFATNTLEIAVPPGNPGGVGSLADLANSGIRLVVCAPEVPCGAAALTVAETAGVTLSPVSEESSVTDVLGKVTSGEADAGLVYVTDVRAAGDRVEGVEFAESADAVNRYPIAAVQGSAGTSSSPLAQVFVDYVVSSVGRAVLRAAGFGAP